MVFSRAGFAPGFAVRALYRFEDQYASLASLVSLSRNQSQRVPGVLSTVSSTGPPGGPSTRPRGGSTCTAMAARNGDDGRSLPSTSSRSSVRSSETHNVNKKALRASIKAALKALTSEEKERQSAIVNSRILDELKLLDTLPASAGVCIYLACESLNEVNAGPILQRAFEKRLRVYVPRVLDRDSNMHFLRVHAHDTYDIVPPFGIREPTLKDALTGKAREDVLESDAGLDVIFMPGLGFGDGGERLGRGGGYYDAFIDRYLSRHDGVSKPLLVGLAFDAQVVNGREVPMDAHDHYLDIVVSPTGVFRRCAGR